MAKDTSSTDYFSRRVSALKVERSSFLSQWQELAYWIDPSKGRFLTDQVNDGERKFKHIVNSRAYQAKRTAVSAMFAGLMSPTRPWLKLEPYDADKLFEEGVRDFLHKTELRMRTIFAESNLYHTAPQVLDSMLQFGTAALADEEHTRDVSRYYAHPVGSFMAARNEDLEVDTFILEKKMTAEQMVGKFGKERVSAAVRTAYDTGNKDSWFEVKQVIEPNPDYTPGRAGPQGKRFRSVWFEPWEQNRNNLLRESGFDLFPADVPAWGTVGSDVYGTDCPGMIALGDVKGLMIYERDKAKAIHRASDPILQGPSSLKNANLRNAPSGVFLFDETQNQPGMRTVFQSDPRVQEMRVDIDAIERRINEAFFVDLFLAISNMRGVQPRNQLELSQRNAEALFVLGPTLERFHRDFLSRVVGRTFQRMVEGDLLPEIPQALEGEPLRIRFISTLAQAQRSAEAGDIERMLAFVGGMAQFDAAAVDKIDGDSTIDQYGHITGVTPVVIRSTEEANAIRESRMQAQREAAQLDAQQKQASANVQNASALKQVVEIGNNE